MFVLFVWLLVCLLFVSCFSVRISQSEVCAMMLQVQKLARRYGSKRHIAAAPEDSASLMASAASLFVRVFVSVFCLVFVCLC